MGIDALLDILTYKRLILEQLLSVSSIFGGFAITGVIAMRTERHRDRIHSLAFGALVVASVALIFATALDAIWLPLSHSPHVLQSVAGVQRLLVTGDSVAWAVLLGAASLMASISLFGFSRSRRMGYFVLTVTAVAVVVFIVDVRVLSGMG